MGFITLVKEAVFDTTDNEGRILHGRSGESFALDPVTTVLLQAGLNTSDKAEALAYLRERIEATDQQLEEGLEAVIQDLRAFNLLISPEHPPQASADLPAGSPESANSAKSHAEPADGCFWGTKPQQSIPQGKLLDWEVFLTGRFLNEEPLPQVSLTHRGYALWRTFVLLLKVGCYRFATSCLHLFHQQKQLQDLQAREWATLCRSLAAIRDHAAVQQLGGNANILARQARRELVYCQCLTRLLAPTAMCLVRSAAFTCYLRALGLPAHLVVGRARFQLSDRFAFHAWVELVGRVVNDTDELQAGYATLYRVPAEEGAPTLREGNVEFLHQTW
jgi:hypothetical protein